MSTQEITDYLTKQVFIERNVVTYRSLSRQFSIHVNAAKNELATYHHNAPYQSQKCIATFLISGILKKKLKYEDDEDVYMDDTPEGSQEDEDDSEEVPQITVTIMNEKDLEEVKSSYEELQSISVYSLSPAALNDAGLICTPTEQVRKTDKEKGQLYAPTVGRVTSSGIKIGASKKKARPSIPVAGPSKPRLLVAPESKPAPKAETKEIADKAQEKPKATGKLQFFSKPKEPPKATVKKEEVDSKKKMFFSKIVEKVPSPPASETKQVTSTNVKGKDTEVETKPVIQDNQPVTARGIKRKSSVGLEPTRRAPESHAISSTSSVAENAARTRRRVVLSDDESDNLSTKHLQRRTKAVAKVESTEASEAEREAMALMDIDDDEVEKVSRVPSTNVSSNEEDDKDQEEDMVTTADDVSMAEDIPVKPKARTKKPKAVVPVGRNGLKKKKVTKTRRTVGADGYMHKEDYSDWESVDGEVDEPEEPAPVKARAKAKPVKQEADSKVVLPPPEREMENAKEVSAQKPPAKASKQATKPPATKAGSTVKGKGQQQKLNFFGPKKT